MIADRLGALVCIVLLAGCSGPSNESWTEDLRTTHWLLSVWGPTADDLFAVGGIPMGPANPPQARLWHYDGASWSTMESPTTHNLYDVWGTSGSDVFASGYSGTVIHYDGSRWSPVYSGTINRLTGIWGIGGANGVFFFVGYNGTVLKLRYDGAF